MAIYHAAPSYIIVALLFAARRETSDTSLCATMFVSFFLFSQGKRSTSERRRLCGRLWVFMRFYIFMDLIGKMELNVNYILCGIDYILLNITEYNILLDIVKYNG